MKVTPGPARRVSALRRHGLDIMRQSHLKFWLANVICGMLPDFGSGVVRGRLYRMAGLHVPADAYIMGNLELIGGSLDFYNLLTLGPGVVIGNHVTINIDAAVHFGRNTSIGPFVKIYTASHPIGTGSGRRVGQVLDARPVTIEDGCWIGVGALILPGVTVGHGSIVAAGAVVDADIPPDSQVEGNPARVVRHLPWGDR